MPPQRADAPLRWSEEVGDGIGDMGFNSYWANISALLRIFCIDYDGPAGGGGRDDPADQAGRCGHRSADGAIADRTRARRGKCRPYLLFAALPMAASGVPPDLGRAAGIERRGGGEWPG